MYEVLRVPYFPEAEMHRNSLNFCRNPREHLITCCLVAGPGKVSIVFCTPPLMNTAFFWRQPRWHLNALSILHLSFAHQSSPPPQVMFASTTYTVASPAYRQPYISILVRPRCCLLAHFTRPRVYSFLCAKSAMYESQKHSQAARQQPTMFPYTDNSNSESPL